MEGRDVKYLIALGQVDEMEQKHIAALTDYFGDAETAWKSPRLWRRALRLKESRLEQMTASRAGLDPDAIDAYRRSLGVKITVSSDADFPAFLRNVTDPPRFLYYLGALPPPERLSVAVVGARNCGDYGRDTVNQIVTDLVTKAGVHIVSGMAEGIDGAAHRAALGAGGFTTAVLGSGVDVVYPACHRGLYREIAAKGCVLSEYPFGCPALKHHFPRRNRLISGLADGVLVAEARRKSGTLHTVGHGLEQGKNIYAIPGSVFSPLSGLPHYLIEMGEAKFTACADDILEDFLGVGFAAERESGGERDLTALASDGAERAVLAELAKGRRGFDELLDISGLSAPALTSFLTLLEIEGAVRETPGNTYTLTNS